ncbi:MAG: rhodanese-like domain-containing protein [Magnetococcus sp. WYHC-3]
MSPSSTMTSLDLPGRFVTTAWLADHLTHPALRLIQVGGESFYHQVHLPGAQLLSSMDILRSVDGVPGMRETEDRLTALLGRMGIGAGTVVVAYDAAGGLDAARLVWTLATLGYDVGAVLDGGIHAWMQEQRPVSPDRPGVTPEVFPLQATSQWTADREGVRRIAQRELDADLLDTRSQREYLGVGMRGPAGHIPGAEHMDWIDALVDNRNPRLKPDAALRQRLTLAGVVDPSREVVVYCQTAHRASHTWVLLRHLGFQRVRLYDGSMSEWGLTGGALVSGEAPR